MSLRPHPMAAFPSVSTLRLSDIPSSYLPRAAGTIDNCPSSRIGRHESI